MLSYNRPSERFRKPRDHGTFDQDTPHQCLVDGPSIIVIPAAKSVATVWAREAQSNLDGSAFSIHLLNTDGTALRKV